jgi:hypothetical protein
MFCCFFHKKKFNQGFNHELNNKLNIEQINVLVSMDRESEISRSSSAYYTSSVYFKDTSIYRQFSNSDEYIIYEVVYNIIDNIIVNPVMG